MSVQASATILALLIILFGYQNCGENRKGKSDLETLGSTLGNPSAGSPCTDDCEPQLDSVDSKPSAAITLTTGQNYMAVLQIDAIDPSNTQLDYQWHRNGIPIVGATNQSYVISNFIEAHEGSYSVTVRNSYASITSFPIVLTLPSVDTTPPAEDQPSEEEPPEDTTPPNTTPPDTTPADTTQPSISLMSVPAIIETNSFEVKISFNEDVTGFSQEDISITNAQLTGFQEVNNRHYEVTVINYQEDEDIRLSIGANKVNDLAGNSNRASGVITTTHKKRKVPTLTSTLPATTTKNFNNVFSLSVSASAYPAVTHYQWLRLETGKAAAEMAATRSSKNYEAQSAKGWHNDSVKIRACNDVGCSPYTRTKIVLTNISCGTSANWIAPGTKRSVSCQTGYSGSIRQVCDGATGTWKLDRNFCYNNNDVGQ